MYQQNVWALTLSSDTFNALKSDFDQVLRKTLTNMENKDSEQAELTVKLKISLTKDEAPNFDSLDRDAKREVVKPKFDHKVSSVMQIKDEQTGTLGGNYELVWDGELGQYVMKEIKDGQYSLFDYADIEPNDDALHGRKVLSIAGSTDPENVIDADYHVVDDDEDNLDEYPEIDEELDENEDDTPENENDLMGMDDNHEDDGYSYDEPEVV